MTIKCTRKNKASIWGIWRETTKERSSNISNYLVVGIFGLLGFAIEFFFAVLNKDVAQSILGTLLSLNGGMLGLMVAGFAFSSTIPKNLMAFLASTKAEDYPWSNFKGILLNYFWAFTALFTGILLFCLCYLISFISSPDWMSNEWARGLKTVYFGVIWMVQGWLLAEIKIFLFWLYDNSLLMGQMVASDEDLSPFDEGNA